jgi:hypothetical protein
MKRAPPPNATLPALHRGYKTCMYSRLVFRVQFPILLQCCDGIGKWGLSHRVPPLGSHITTDSQSASLSWCQSPIRDPRPIFLSP